MDGQAIRSRRADVHSAACEGTSTLFEVNYIDDQKAYLTQSGQLYAEAIAMALGKVYTFGPTFRAENPRPAVTSPSSGCLSRKLPTSRSTKLWPCEGLVSQ